LSELRAFHSCRVHYTLWVVLGTGVNCISSQQIISLRDVLHTFAEGGSGQRHSTGGSSIRVQTELENNSGHVLKYSFLGLDHPLIRPHTVADLCPAIGA